MQRHFIGTPTAGNILKGYLDFDDADVLNDEDGPPLDFDEAMTKLNSGKLDMNEDSPTCVDAIDAVKDNIKSIGFLMEDDGPPAGSVDSCQSACGPPADECDSSGSTRCGFSDCDASPANPGRMQHNHWSAGVEEVDEEADEDSEAGEHCDEEYESDFESESEYETESESEAESTPVPGAVPGAAGEGAALPSASSRARSGSRVGRRERSSSRTGPRRDRSVAGEGNEGGASRRSSSRAGSRPRRASSRAGSRTRGPASAQQNSVATDLAEFKNAAAAIRSALGGERPPLPRNVASSGKAALAADLADFKQAAAAIREKMGAQEAEKERR